MGATYQSYWGIRCAPFRGCFDPEFFYQSPTHEEALARLHFLVEQRRRMGLLIGAYAIAFALFVLFEGDVRGLLMGRPSPEAPVV